MHPRTLEKGCHCHCHGSSPGTVPRHCPQALSPGTGSGPELESLNRPLKTAPIVDPWASFERRDRRRREPSSGAYIPYISYTDGIMTVRPKTQGHNDGIMTG